MSDEERDPEGPMEEEEVNEGALDLFVEDGDSEEEEEEDDDDYSTAEDGESDHGEGAGEDCQPFDLEIPTQHRYLGESREVAGRFILDELNLIIEDLPIISKSDIILMPGQVIPITIFHPSVISAMKRLIDSTKTFGFIHSRDFRELGDDVKRQVFGTTAEIFEFYEPPPESLEVGLKIKARGRQRFKLLNSRTLVDGNRVASVRILEEIEPPNLWHEIRLASRDRFKTRAHTQNIVNSRINNDLSVMTAWPSWVFDLYNQDILVKRVHKQMEKLKLYSQDRVKIPTDPQELSFWIATNFPLDESHRFKILEINCAIQRLRYQLCLMEKSQLLCCRNCGEEVGTQDNIFSMSLVGPQGAYVNPGGFVHETLTLEKAQNLTLVGRPSTEYSWFPGYSWTICQCQVCEVHMGWKFKATTKNLHPHKFWGLSRRSLKTKIEVSTTMNFQDQIKPVL